MSIRANAASEFLRRTANLPSSTSFTLCGWARKDGAGDPSFSAIGEMGDAGASSSQGIYETSGGDLALASDVEGATVLITPMPSVGTWFFWAVRCSGTGGSGLQGMACVHGGSPVTVSMTGTSLTPGNIFISGRFGDGLFNGSQEHIRCWDTALTDDELLLEMYSTLPVRQANLNFAWRTISASSVADLGPNARDATVTGTLTVSDDPPIYDLLYPPQGQFATVSSGGLPTANLTLHLDASNTDDLFTTFDVSGVHTGTPNDGDPVEAWDDEGDGIADVVIGSASGPASPAYRAAVMEHGALDFDGSDDYMVAYSQTGITAKNSSDFVTVSAFTIIVAIHPEAITTTASAPYQNHAVVSDRGENFGLYLKDVAGVKKALAYNWDGNADSVLVDISEDQTSVVMLRHEGGNLYISVNGGAESSVASGNSVDVSDDFQLGWANDAASNYDGLIGEVAVWNAALTGSDLTDALAYFTDKWLAEEEAFSPVRRTFGPQGMLRSLMCR